MLDLAIIFQEPLQGGNASFCQFDLDRCSRIVLRGVTVANDHKTGPHDPRPVPAPLRREDQLRAMFCGLDSGGGECAVGSNSEECQTITVTGERKKSGKVAQNSPNPVPLPQTGLPLQEWWENFGEPTAKTVQDCAGRIDKVTVAKKAAKGSAFGAFRGALQGYFFGFFLKAIPPGEKAAVVQGAINGLSGGITGATNGVVNEIKKQCT